MAAAIDSAGAQMEAAIRTAVRRAASWPAAIRAGVGALFNFLASRPALARLVAVEAYAAGPAAVERRVEYLRPLEELIAEGRERAREAGEGAEAASGGGAVVAGTTAITAELIAGVVYALAYRQIREKGPEALPALAPLCTYLALAPFIGAEEACAVANGDGRGRGG